MSTRKQAKQSNLLTNENSINVVESIGNNMSATRIRQAKARKLITAHITQQGCLVKFHEEQYTTMIPAQIRKP